MSCVPIDDQLQDLLNKLGEGRVPADEIPADLLNQPRWWGWVIGQERLELTGIGYSYAGEVKKGLLR